MKHLIFVAGLILAAAFSRLIPHPPNFTPIAALALSSAVYLDKRYALLLPLAAMLLSDWVIGFHSGMPWVYGSFAVISLMGYWLRSHKKPAFILGATLTSSVLFFAVTNFGVWLGSTFYPQTWDGLVACYVAALPFFQNTLAGDFMYTGAMFGLFELAARWFKVEQAQTASAGS